jgi:hypothetical protein
MSSHMAGLDLVISLPNLMSKASLGIRYSPD